MIGSKPLLCGALFVVITSPLAAQNNNTGPLQPLIDALMVIQRQKAAEAARKADSTSSSKKAVVPPRRTPAPVYAPQIPYDQSEQANEWFGFGTNVVQSPADCGSVAARQARLGRDAVAFRQASRVLERFGQAFTIATAFAQSKQGHDIAATQTVYESVLDQHLCEYLFKSRTPHGAAACAGWTAGRTIGSFIEKLPSGRYASDGTPLSIDDVWTDTLADAWISLKAKYGARPLTEHNYKLLIQAARMEAQEARSKEVELQGLRSVCRRAEIRNEVDEMLERTRQPQQTAPIAENAPISPKPPPAPPLEDVRVVTPVSTMPPTASPVPTYSQESSAPREARYAPSAGSSPNPEVRCGSPPC